MDKDGMYLIINKYKDSLIAACDAMLDKIKDYSDENGKIHKISTDKSKGMCINIKNKIAAQKELTDEEIKFLGIICLTTSEILSNTIQKQLDGIETLKKLSQFFLSTN